MCCGVVLCCSEKGTKAGEKPVGAASRIAYPSHQLTDDNLTKAQAAGLQLNCTHTLVAWRRGVLHRSTHAKVHELHEANARLTDILAKGCGNAINCGFGVVPTFGHDDADLFQLVLLGKKSKIIADRNAILAGQMLKPLIVPSLNVKHDSA